MTSKWNVSPSKGDLVKAGKEHVTVNIVEIARPKGDEITVTGQALSQPKHSAEDTDKMPLLKGMKQRTESTYRTSPWLLEMIAEGFGTGLLVFIGTMTTASAVLTGSQHGVWQIAVNWALAVSLSIYITAHLSGAHLNPAISTAFFVFRSTRSRFSIGRLMRYITAQIIGAFGAACLTYGLWLQPYLRQFETENGIDRDCNCPESAKSAMILTNYYPVPNSDFFDLVADGSDTGRVDALAACFASEFLGTFILAAVIFALSDHCNTAVSTGDLVPLIIGLTVASMISIFGVISMAGFNPARDLGPRLAAAAFGWGTTAFPGPFNHEVWVYTVAPILGAAAGGGMIDVLLSRPCTTEECCARKSD
eukprot:Clim_evm77s77 gene=Clim_evmTU77s77